MGLNAQPEEDLERRVVVTGIGIIAPNGIGKELYWKALAEGKSGIKQIKGFDVNSFPTQIAGEVQDFDSSDFMSPRDVKRTARTTQFAIAAAKMAVSDSQLKIEEESEVGVAMGVSASASDVVETHHALFMERGVSRVSPFLVTSAIPNASASNISILLGCKGAVTTISNSCPAGLDAIGSAFGRIRDSKDDVFIAGGTDAQVTPFGLAMLCAPRIMSTRNDDPEGASRPFDRTRDGGILSEGVGVLVLEEMQHAMNRGAHIYAEILGYANRADGIGVYDEEILESGVKRAMALALKDAHIKPQEVDYICAHAPSDEFDRIESIAIKQVFGKHAYEIPVSSIKSMIGNPLSAAGPLQVVASIMVLERGIIPPTINHKSPDKDCDLDYVPGKARECKGINTILINTHGFGGINSTLIIRRYSNSNQIPR